MAAERLSMRQIREILRQKWALGLSHRAVAQSLGVGLGTISSVVTRAQGAGLDWPQVQPLSDDAWEGRLHGRPEVAGQRQRPAPDCAWIHAERRRFIIPGLRRLGFGIATEPTGAFYVLANARRFTADSYAFAFEILEQARVGVAPGVDFGKNGEGYLRFSYANSLDNLAEALRRLEAFLAGRSG